MKYSAYIHFLSFSFLYNDKNVSVSIKEKIRKDANIFFNIILAFYTSVDFMMCLKLMSFLGEH